MSATMTETQTSAMALIESMPRAVPPTHVRYSSRMLGEARRLYAGGSGMTPTQIRTWLQENVADGPVPSIGTVRRWVIESEAEEQRRLNRASAHRRRRIREGKPMWRSGRLEDDELNRRMLELRALGMPYPTIALIVSRYHGADLDGRQVRYRLRSLGVVPQAAKSAATRRQWAAARS